MAVYKVPQDVEADDKLIGPFSFRQFIYLIIVAISGALAWGLFQLLPPLVILPLPIMIFFGALALPLRKDQPMEIYLAAIVSFYLKPRKRLWEADGIQSLVEITAPKVIEVQRMKDLSQAEAQKRLSYLANVVDTGGWAVRGVAAPEPNTPMNDDIYFEAQQAPDMLDESTGVGRSFDTRLGQADVQRRQDMIQRLHQEPAAVTAPASSAQKSSIADPYAQLKTTPDPAAASNPSSDPHVTFSPYPNAMHQSVIQPMSDQPASSAKATSPEPPTSTSEKTVSPDIMNLANNPDLSIETIAREAERIHKREAELSGEEVVISLR
ncbi:MAG: PrgI family protein [Candidatus Saccharibacteria bacterium]